MINYKVINILGIISVFLGLSMIPSSLWSLYYSESDFLSFVKSSLITISIGLLFYFSTRIKVKKENKDLQSIEGFTIVSLGWIVMGIFSSLYRLLG